MTAQPEVPLPEIAAKHPDRARIKRGIEFYESGAVSEHGDLFIVRGTRNYIVDLEHGHCSCPDFQHRLSPRFTLKLQNGEIQDVLRFHCGSPLPLLFGVLDIRTYVRLVSSYYPGAHSSFPFPHLWTGTGLFLRSTGRSTGSVRSCRGTS
jgi:hypothetical protein